MALFRGYSSLFDANMGDIGFLQSPYKVLFGTEKDDIDGEKLWIGNE